MKFKEFLANLNKFAQENPETLELDTVTSKDDEGNAFNLVYFEPTKGFLEDRAFIAEDNLEEWGRDKDDINAVCVN